jgi:hypothetical protein
MKTFIQFKDDVAFTTVQTPGETEGIEVFTDNPEQFLNKKYINDSWVDAPVIRYAILDDSNTVVQIDKTYFSSLVGANIVIEDGTDVRINSVWNGVSFTLPTYIEPLQIAEPIVDEPLQIAEPIVDEITEAPIVQEIENI